MSWHLVFIAPPGPERATDIVVAFTAEAGAAHHSDQDRSMLRAINGIVGAVEASVPNHAIYVETSGHLDHGAVELRLEVRGMRVLQPSAAPAIGLPADEMRRLVNEG